MGSSASSYLEIKELKHLKPVMDKRDEGQESYLKDVKNKMKPKWLTIQIATHSLSAYWVMWFDQNILKEQHIYEVKRLCQGGFDIMPFESWN